MPDDPAIARINALTANARTTWFALLGTLVFVGITLMGVEHIDFYGTDRATKLPLVDVSVPTRSFFVAAPILTTAIYGYFHLYLIRLWDALGAAPPRPGDHPLGVSISPWLVSDAALHLRRRLRGDNCTPLRPLEAPSMVLNLALAWGFGLLVLAALWWMSMPARQFRMTGIAGLALILALLVGSASFALLLRRMRDPALADTRPRLEVWVNATTLAALLPAIALVSSLRTAGSAGQLAAISLATEEIVARPERWLPFDIARADFRATWCARERVADCADLGARQTAFDTEWITRRMVTLAELPKPDWSKVNRPKPDFREAFLPQAFLAGADLQFMRFEGAFLASAQMEGALLSSARLAGVHMPGARLETASLENADLTRANLIGARLEGANLQGARLDTTALDRADLTRAVLAGALIRRTGLWNVRLNGASLNNALLGGATDPVMKFDGTDLRGATFHGAALRNVDLSLARIDATTDLRNSFGDATVRLPPGVARPCQWAETALTDAAFHAALTAWWAKRPAFGFSDPPPEPEPSDSAARAGACTWATTPLPGAPPPATFLPFEF